jgi:hypothetical protein
MESGEKRSECGHHALGKHLHLISAVIFYLMLTMGFIGFLFAISK